MAVEGKLLVLIAYWAAKGGSGATVLAAGHALRAATDRPTLLVDLDGDLPGALGVPEPASGVSDWLAAGADVPADALDRIAMPIGTHLHLLGRGTRPIAGAPDDVGDDRAGNPRTRVLTALLRQSGRLVVADCGTRPTGAGAAIARHADRSVLVTRACYLAIQRQRATGLAPSELALVVEPDRALTPTDVATALGAPIRTRVPVSASIARAVDSGLLARRLPGVLRRAVTLDPAPGLASVGRAS